MEPQAHDTYTHAEDGRVCILLNDGSWWVPLDAGGEGYSCDRRHGGPAHHLIQTPVGGVSCSCGQWEPKLGESSLRSYDRHLLSVRDHKPGCRATWPRTETETPLGCTCRPRITNHGLPLHRTQATHPPESCSTCGGAGCLDCTDPA